MPRIVGLDLGRKSVKAVLVDSSYKQFEAQRFAEVPLPPPIEGMSWARRAAGAVKVLIEQHDMRGDITVTAIPGDEVTTRVLELPFTRSREIEMVLGPELEEILPFSDIDDVVFDYQILERTDAGSRLLVAVARREDLRELLEALKEVDVDPKIVTVSGFAKADLLRNMSVIQDGPLMLCDIGHETTDVTVVRNGAPILWRAFRRGGRRVSEALAAVAPDDREGASAAMGKALTPIVRDLKQTLLAAEGLTGTPITAVYLCGGASRVGGLAQYFSHYLGVDVVSLEPSTAPFNQIPNRKEIDAVVTEPLALALRALPSSVDQVNLRKGEFGFHGEFEYLQGKVTAVAVALVAFFVLLGGLAYSKYYALQQEEAALIGDLKAKTTAILGREISDFATAAAAVTSKGGPKENPIPDMDAYRILFDVSNGIGDDVLVDVDTFEVDLERHRAEIRGRTSSADNVETIADRLSKLDCFEKVDRERNEKGTDDRQIFHLSIKLGC